MTVYRFRAFPRRHRKCGRLTLGYVTHYPPCRTVHEDFWIKHNAESILLDHSLFHSTPQWQGVARQRYPLSGIALSPLKASPGRIAVFEAPMPVAALRSIPHSGESHPWSTVWFVKDLIFKHILLIQMPYGLKKQTIPQQPYSIIIDWQPVIIDAGALWVRMRTVGCLRSMIRAQSGRRNIRFPVSRSQERQPDPSLNPIPQTTPPGLITLLFSCIATAWLTGHCILRKGLRGGKKAHSEWNPLHLRYRPIDKVLIFKCVQFN